MIARLANLRSLLAAALATACAAGCGGLQKGTAEARYAQREFNSTMELLVVAQTGSGEEQIGWTPAARPLVIPACRMWWVRYEGKDMAALRREVQLKDIPGLELVKAKRADLVALQDLGNLRVLSFDGVEVTDECLVNLKNLNSLQTLGMGHSDQVTDRGLACIKGLTSLRDLDLAWTGVTDLGLAQVKEFTCLQKLNLSNTSITDAGLAHLQGLKALQWLDLHGTGVTSAGLIHLRELKALQWLNLGRTEVTDGGMEHLQGLEALRWLNLEGAPVKDAGLERLRNLKSLKTLSVPYEASDEAIAALKKAIPGLKTIP